MADRQLPSGVVTFFFSDLERSTAMARALGAAWTDVLSRHHEMVRAVVEANGGVEVKTAGDGFFVAFATPDAAVLAAADLQQRVAADASEPRVAVRIGLHTGTAVVTDDDYVGLAVHQAARVAGAAVGGQILATDAVRQLTSAARMVELGAFEIKDFGDLRLHEVVWDASRQVSRPRADTVDRVNLPGSPSPLIGREDELAEVQSLLAAHRVVTLTGAGGVGKTRLAVEAARAAAPMYPAGVWFVDLTTAASDDEVAAAVARALDIRDAGKQLEAVVSRLGPRHALLVLDNCEHVIEGAASLVSSIVAGTGAGVLATSRESLAISAEASHVVPPMRAEAVELFCARAANVRTGFAVDQSEREVVAAICEQLDGMPLAIELAASLAQSLTIHQIAQRLDDRFGLLQSRSRDKAARQRTLWAAVDWSHQLLEEQERIVLRRLAVFAGGFTVEAAEAVVPDAALPDAASPVTPGSEATVPEHAVVHVLDRLVSKSLVVPDPDRLLPGFRLLETIREYALDRLVEAGEVDAVRSRHLRWAVDLADWARAGLLGPDEVRCFTVMDAEIGNVRGALDWGIDHECEIALFGVARLLDYLGTRADPAGALALAERALERDVGSDSLRAAVHAGASYLGLLAGDQGAVQRHAQAALALVGHAPAAGPDVWSAGWAMVNLSVLASESGSHDEAEDLLTRVLALDGSPEAFAAHSRALQILGSIRVDSGLVDEGLDLMREGVALLRDRGMCIGRCYILETLGNAELRQGRVLEAIASFEEALVTAEQIREPVVVQRSGLALALMLNALGQDPQRVEALMARVLGLAADSWQMDLLRAQLRAATQLARRSMELTGSTEPGLRGLAMTRDIALRLDDDELLAEVAAVERELRVDG